MRGIPTPFVESFDDAIPATESKPESEAFLNYFLTPDELQKSGARSELLSDPDTKLSGQYTEASSGSGSDETHAAAMAALNRITALSNGSSKDRLRVNIQRCISVFGRHHTEQTLPEKAAPAQTTAGTQLEKTPRAGPDTGSSEVQIAILTAKIRTLADFLETRGKTDKVNKRNLRLLVHRRQKHLAYLRRKERGGPRWQNVIETLGLTEGTWKGEISL